MSPRLSPPQESSETAQASPACSPKLLKHAFALCLSSAQGGGLHSAIRREKERCGQEVLCGAGRLLSGLCSTLPPPPPPPWVLFSSLLLSTCEHTRQSSTNNTTTGRPENHGLQSRGRRGGKTISNGRGWNRTAVLVLNYYRIVAGC